MPGSGTNALQPEGLRRLELVRPVWWDPPVVEARAILHQVGFTDDVDFAIWFANRAHFHSGRSSLEVLPEDPPGVLEHARWEVESRLYP